MGENRVHKNIDRFNERLRDVAGDEIMEISVLKEAYTAIVHDLIKFDEDQNWQLLIGGSGDSDLKGLSLKDLQEVVPYLEKQTKILQDLLGRGLRLKNNHVFGRGFRFERTNGEELQPRFQAIIEDPVNQECLFSPAAMKALNRVWFTAGNLLAYYNKKTKRAQILSIDTNIENWISEDEDPSRVKYFLRTWRVRDDINKEEEELKREWVPTSTYAATNPKMPSTIPVGNERVSVNKDAVIVFKAINKDVGETFGVPDAFGAAAPAHVYASYVRDGAMLQHALAAISFVIKAKTQAQAKTAGAKVQNGRVGQAAITGPETDIQAMPRAGTINLYEGRPLVARVASALDVSTTGITSDPGTGGSYASENALSAPEQMSALSRQEDFSSFFAELFRVMGAKDIHINWNRLDADPIHRALQSLGIARTLGGISQAEFRARVLELLDIEALSTEMPEPDEFTGSKYASLKDSILKSLEDDPDADNSGNPIASQGNSGAVGSLDDDNSARDSDRDSGTA